MMMIILQNALVLFLAAVGTSEAFAAPSSRSRSSPTRLFNRQVDARYDYETSIPPPDYYQEGPQAGSIYPDQHFDHSVQVEREDAYPPYHHEGEQQLRDPASFDHREPEAAYPNEDYYRQSRERVNSNYHPGEEYYNSYPEEERNYVGRTDSVNPNWDRPPIQDKNVNDDWNRFYGESRNEFDNFHEQRSYDSVGGPAPLQSDRIPGRQQDFRNNNRGRPSRLRNRRKRAVGGMHSDGIPGRNQRYADSKDAQPRRGADLWSQVFGGSSTSPRSAMDTTRQRRGDGLSPDLRAAMRGQQQTLLPLLEEALRYVQADPACYDLLGTDIRLDQPFSQTQSSGSVDGRPQESRVNVQVAAEGTLDGGVLDVLADNLGIREMILALPSGRRISVKLGISPDGIDLVDRGPDFANRRPVPDDVLDVEFEQVLPVHINNHHHHNHANDTLSYNNSQW